MTRGNFKPRGITDSEAEELKRISDKNLCRYYLDELLEIKNRQRRKAPDNSFPLLSKIGILRVKPQRGSRVVLTLYGSELLAELEEEVTTENE